jgi:hypothetical protein
MMNEMKKPQALWKRLFALAGAFVLTGAALALPTVSNGSFADNFTSYPAAACLTDGATFGVWNISYAGYGCVSLAPSPGYVQVSPEVSTKASETHAALVLGPAFTNPVTFSATVTTVKQLRTGSAPNAWEVGWVLWDYTTDNNFYAFTPQPNGWELTKEDPSYPGAQRYLATGTSPAFPVGGTYVVTVTQTGTNSMSVSVNGKLITSFTDTQTPYTSGKIGLYSEDSTVQYTNVAVSAAAATAPTPAPVPVPVPTPAPIASVPKLSEIAPATSVAGGAAFSITVDGTNFTSGSVVQWNGAACTSTVKSATSIVADVTAADIAAAGTASVTVTTPGAAVSNAETFTVTEPANQATNGSGKGHRHG